MDGQGQILMVPDSRGHKNTKVELNSLCSVSHKGSDFDNLENSQVLGHLLELLCENACE